MKLASSDEIIQKSLGEIHVTKDIDGNAILALWAAEGAALGALEQKKAAILAGTGQSSNTATVAKAQKRWIRVVSTVVDILDHISDAPEAAEALRRSVVEPAQKATQRFLAARKAKAPQEQSPPAQGS